MLPDDVAVALRRLRGFPRPPLGPGPYVPLPHLAAAEPVAVRTGRSWWVPRPVDEGELAESAALLLGEHDFRAFTPTQTQHRVFMRDR